jgi:uncharacterized membrane protein
MTVPDWALSLSFWLHMLATVVWLGGLAAIRFFVLQDVGEETPLAQAQRYDRAQTRLDPAAWFALVVLVATGLVQMAANANYDGLLAVNNPWSQAILLKHIIFVGVIALSAYLTWGSFPALRRAILREAHGQATTDLPTLLTRSRRLLDLNVLLGLMVLVFTAWARVAG